MKWIGIVVHAYNPSAREAETGWYLGLAGHLAYLLEFWASKRPYLKNNEVDVNDIFWGMILQVVLWPVYICGYVHAYKYMHRY